MRSSDWSSDVCSSDLKRGDDAFDALLGDADIGIRCGLFLDAWAHARVTFMGVTLLGVKIDARAQVYLGYDQGRIYSAYADAEFEVTVKIGCAEYKSKASFEVRRSEEHTSELQSLMHTSYAVFCLNKKKRIKRNKL